MPAPGAAVANRSSRPISSQNSPSVDDAGEVVGRAGVAVGDVVEDVVDHVLADPLLAVAAKVDHRSTAA